MTNNVNLEIIGMDKVIANLDKFGKEIRSNTTAAGREVGSVMLNTVGLRRYPSETDANKPGRIKSVVLAKEKISNFRVGYYVRGQGWMQPVRGGGYKQIGSSQRYGTRWTVNTSNSGVRIANSASYAPYLAGEDDQVGWAGERGWRKLVDVANEKLTQITGVYQAWVDRIIRTLGL